MKSSVCRHIKTNGIRCKSPSLTGDDMCYFHARLFERQGSLIHNNSSISTGTATYQPDIPPLELDLPILEDAESIQVSITLLVAALARNRIDSKRAAVLLYGLQLAATNVKATTLEPYAANVVRSIVESSFGTDLASEDSAATRTPALPPPSSE
jgi:hypothetical protein